MRSGLLGTEESVEAECDHSLEKFDCYIIDNEQVKKFILDEDAVMRATPTCFVDVEKKVVTIGTDKVPLTKANAEALSSATWKGA